MKKMYSNGKIYLGDENSWAESIVTDGDKIVFVGSESEAKSKYSDAKRVNLKGNYMFPGFIDAHAHIILAAYLSSGLLVEAKMSKEKVLSKMKKFVAKNPKKNAYFGQGYGEMQFGDKGPTKEDLDSICKDKPLLMLSAGGHEGFCNTKALEMAGINKDTKDPVQGLQFFHRDAAGNPTGRFTEAGCIYMIVERIMFFNADEVEGQLSMILDYFASVGITGIADCGSMSAMVDTAFPLLCSMSKQGKLKQRFIGCEFVSTAEERVGAVERLKERHNKYYIKDNVEINTLKIINDGTFESINASTIEPYCHDGSIVAPMLEGEVLEELCVEAASEGFDIHIHGIGDRSIRANLNAAKAVREAGYNDVRFTNAHTVLVTKEDVSMFGEYDVVANTTGGWHNGSNDEIKKILGERADELYCIRKLTNKGAVISMGSDFPVDEVGIHPMIAIETAVTRQEKGKPDAPRLKPYDQALTVKEVIDGYTKNAAYQIGKQDKLGTIEVGKYADFTVFKENPFKADPHKIHKIKVFLTIKNGEETYRATLKNIVKYGIFELIQSFE